MLNRLTRKPLRPEEIETLIDGLGTHILRWVSPEEVIVFGSAARGEMTDGSDLDVALIFSSESECAAARKTLLSQPNPIHWPIDYLFFSREGFETQKRLGGVGAFIAEEGRRLTPKKQAKPS